MKFLLKYMLLASLPVVFGVIVYVAFLRNLGFSDAGCVLYGFFFGLVGVVLASNCS